MTQFVFEAYAVTPVHIGSGRTVDPGSFLLENDGIRQFSPGAVVGDLAPKARTELQQLADRGDFKGLQAFFRRHCDPGRHSLGLIALGEGAQAEFEAYLTRPERRFEVQLMPRNPATGQAYLPGSSLKGAIRTAVVNHFANRVPALRQSVHEAVYGEERMNRKATALEEAALGRSLRDTERDPFRLVGVLDCQLSPEAIRIDRAYNWNPSPRWREDPRRSSEGIQIWVERLRCRADAGAAGLQITIQLNEAAMRDQRVGLGRRFGMETIAEACNAFYWGRLQAEIGKFFPKMDGRPSATATAIYRALGDALPLDGQGRRQIKAPTWPYLLLRVGRFSHFESLSVDELRCGHRPQARSQEGKQIRDPEMGSTRTLCDIGGPTRLPFGWLLLSHRDT